MLVENVTLPAIQPFTSGYLAKDAAIMGLFHYDYEGNGMFEARADELKKRTFHREELVRCIRSYIEPFPQGEAVEQSLNKLEKDAFVVIGGQQAGLLTGPLYTIHKALSVIHLAKQQEKLLGHPVVPVFWIAGEDHDFLEINHVYTPSGGSMQKKGYPERVEDKRMASAVSFDKDEMKKWVRSIIRDFGETAHTKEILGSLDEAVAHTSTIVEFFSYITMSFFKNEGLLVIDSASPELRQLEKPFFHELLDASDKLTEAVKDQQTSIRSMGYRPLIELSDRAANLFLEVDGERLLLERTERGFEDKNKTVWYTKEELHELIDREPHRFSNNVVTRPLMQEWLFPSLSFIAGPGEIAYWAELKQAFEKTGMSMPPIVPRLTLSIVEPPVAEKISELGLSVASVLERGVKKEKEAFWKSVENQSVSHFIEEAEQWLTDKYEQLKAHEAIDGQLPEIIEKNLAFHKRQFGFLQKKADDEISRKHSAILSKYDDIECRLRPFDGPQERTWNVYYYLNRYGTDFIQNLVDETYVFDGKHKVIYL